MLRPRRSRAAAQSPRAALAARGGHVDRHGLFESLDHPQNAQLSLGFKLLDSTTGGKHGGGATLTPEGEKLLDAYDSYCTRLRAYAQELFGETFDEILP